MTDQDTRNITVFGGNSLHAPMEELAPQFERESGHRLSIIYETAKQMFERMAKGETPDVLIVSSPNMDTLVEQGRIVAASRTDLIRNSVGIAVRSGAPRPDISTTEAFKNTLLGAKSIAFASAGTSGIYFVELIKRMGVEAQVLAKARTRPGGLIAKLVANGEAELALQQIPELLAVPGIDLVGPLPREVQLDNVMCGGVFGTSACPEAAHAFIRFLASPASMRVFLAKGFLKV